MIDWNNIFKIRLSNKVEESLDKHDILKLMIVRKILRKYRKRFWIRVYTEHKLNGIIPDIYMENLKDKSVTCWEIQKKINDKWTKKILKKYNDYEIPFINPINLIIVPLLKTPDNISELNKWLDDYIP